MHARTHTRTHAHQEIPYDTVLKSIWLRRLQSTQEMTSAQLGVNLLSSASSDRRKIEISPLPTKERTL